MNFVKRIIFNVRIIVAFIMDAIVVIVGGGALAFAYAKTKTKEGSLSKK